MDAHLKKLLINLTDNQEFNQPNSSVVEEQELFSGLPDSFGVSPYKRFERHKKTQINPNEYESDLIKQIARFNDAVAIHKSKGLEVESIRIKLIDSKIELGKLIAEGESEYMEALQTKYQLIENVLQDTTLDNKYGKSPKESNTKQTELNQAQITVLFYYLKSTGIIAKSLNNTLFSKAISELTGFSSSKIRQGLSTVSEYSNSIDSMRFTDKDFTEVISQLNNVLEKIKERVNRK